VNEPSVAAASPTLEAALNGLAEALFDKRTVHLDDSTATAAATEQHQLDADDELLLDENTDLALSSPSLALILPLVGAVLEDAPSPAAAQVALRLVAAHAGGAQLDDDVSVHA
jgi:predicted transcriptional regulator